MDMERGPIGQENLEANEWKARKLGLGIKALAGLDVAMLSAIKERGINVLGVEVKGTMSDEEAERTPFAARFIEKAVAGYRAAEAAEQLIDQEDFDQTVADYERRAAEAVAEEEKQALADQLDAIRSSREQRMQEEQHNKGLGSKLLSLFANAIK